ncbi:MAG: hypothetical protein GEU93_01465 [Propionibacteriales bacterium]|nr:hypothetical protein [Propionibacteriales bacterium]
MNKFLKAFVAALAGVFGLGLLVTGLTATTTTAGADDKVYAKRDDEVTEVELVSDDDDDDDSNSWSRSRRSRDNTNSRHTPVSRDRDLSRGDLTRDWTRDGKGDRKRDWSRFHTKDRSRNDTR